MLSKFCIIFIRTMFFNLSTSFVFSKIKKCKNVDKMKNGMIIIVNLIISIIYAILYYKFKNKNINTAITNGICYIIYFIIFLKIINIKFEEWITLSFLSISFSFISLIISSTIIFTLMKIISANLFENTITEYLLIGIIQLILIYLFFKIKRFKNGFTFLEKSRTVKNFGLIISLITILASITLGIYSNQETRTVIFMSFVLGGLTMLIWLRKSITKYYKERMKDRTVELQSEKLKEKDEIISNLNQELSNVLEINHKYNKRLSAMEKAIGNFGNKLSFNEEFAKEYSDILDSLKDLSKEYKQEFENYNILPKTNIFSIDNLLDYMKTEAIRNNIEFELEINEDINELIEKHISKNKLETLLGDHITDAIIAINASDNSYKKIKVILGKDKEFYKISVLDTGIEFKIETLLKLGLERTTTHKDSGGTGIGFMTTFETLKDCKASLIIEEYNKENYYTKAVTIKFDNKNEYRINSVRIEEILDKDIDKRIIKEINK